MDFFRHGGGVGRLHGDIVVRLEPAVGFEHGGDHLQPSSFASILRFTEEAFGLVALEAMAAGRPVIAADHGGLQEIVANGETGLLVAPGDADALRDALRRLHSDPDLRARMGAAAIQRVKRFTPARVVPELEDVYGQLTEAP